MNRKDFDSELSSYITDLVASGGLSAEIGSEIYSHIKKLLEGREDFLVEGLAEKIHKWETNMGEDEKSLYSLGLRHAVDFIRGIEPSVAKEYKPLGEDFRPN